jgi:hypothetical protein
MLHTQIAALGLAAACLAVCGCGSSKSTTTTAATQAATASTQGSTASAQTTTTSTHTETESGHGELIAKANAVCKQIKAIVAANNPKHGVPHETLNYTAERIARTGSDENQESTQLAHLTSSSPSAAGNVQQTITAVHTLAGGISTYAVYVKMHKPETMDHEILIKVTADINKLRAIATREGLTECANPE